MTADGEVVSLNQEIGFTNGIAFDPDRRKFYCNDTFRCTWVFDVADDLSLSNRQQFLAKEDVDGMALDSEGNVWITGFRSNYLTRLTPRGEELERIQTPPGSITQVRFGGADGCDYFINVVPADGGDTLKEGGEITQANSVLYRGRSQVPGMLVPPARFRLG
jgi:sugar lactone lactonase YvrE